jgi:hypothetical protein
MTVAKPDPVRRLANRVFLTISGRWFRAYSIVRHVGRSSGREYQNPVSAYPLGDGFVLSGPITKDHEGTRHPGLRVGAPRRAVGRASQPVSGAGRRSVSRVRG